MRKVIAGAALAIIVSGVGAPAFAGEVGGNGKPTPIKDYTAASICAFNGLDDGSESGAPVTPGVVQSFGSIVAGFAREGGVSTFAHDGVIHDEGPGTNCRGNVVGEE